MLYRLKRLLCATSALAILWLTSTSLVLAQSSSSPTIVVNYREVQLTPEDMTLLIATYPAMQSSSVVTDTLSKNITYFWEYLGAFDSGFAPNASFVTLAVVQINESGFFETLIGLDSEQQSVEWISLLDTSISTNFSEVITSATDFFSDDGHYWGLCEEIVVIPGSLEGQTEDIIWKLQFYLVAEQERWTLLLDTSGTLLHSQATTVPCQSCDNSLLVILGLSGFATVTVVLIVVVMQRRIQ